jgi:acyl carrier protein
MTIEESIKEILVEDIFVEMAKDDISPTASLRQDIGLDSLGFVELKTQVESRHGIVIPDDDFTPENFATVESLASLVERRRSADGAQRH